MKPTFLLLLAVASPLGAQNPGVYFMETNPAGSPMIWQGGSIYGPLQGDPNFALVGEVGLYVNSLLPPFGSASFSLGLNQDLITNPTELYGYLPNPLPNQPPLVEVWVRDSDLYLSSNSFSVDAATGAFSVSSAVMEYNDGEVEAKAFGSSAFLPLAGLSSDPFTMSGTLIQYGGKIELAAPIQFKIQGTLGGLSVVFAVRGPFYVECATVGIAPNLRVPPLVEGQPAAFTLDTGLPSSKAWLVASIAGPGSVDVNPLRISLGLAAPILIGATMTDVAGGCAWNLTVPKAAGLPVWFQVCQWGTTSNVVATSIQ